MSKQHNMPTIIKEEPDILWPTIIKEETTYYAKDNKQMNNEPPPEDKMNLQQ